MADTTVRTQIRLPSELYETLRAAAALSGRSLNAEMLHRLELSVDDPDRSSLKPVDVALISPEYFVMRIAERAEARVNEIRRDLQNLKDLGSQMHARNTRAIRPRSRERHK